jgi:hypothetical protein
MRFRKKPVVIEAVQLLEETFTDCLEFVGQDNLGDGTSQDELCIEIVTLEGNMMAREEDWIIRGVKGEVYPCKLDIFEATYEPIEE